MGNSPKRRDSSGCGGCLLLILAAVVVFSVLRYLGDRSLYAKGHEAYLRADCDAAIDAFDDILEAWRAYDFAAVVPLVERERAECGAFQTAVDEQEFGNLAGAIFAYNDFLDDYNAGPLVSAAKRRIQSIFEETPVDELASGEFCDQIDALQRKKLIPEQDSRLPTLLYQCGQNYQTTRDYSNAVKMYDKFLAAYPGHSLASAVEDALIRSVLANARASDAGTIAAPEQSGETGDDSTVVVIQNDSPRRLRIVFSGPESRIEELGPCGSCMTYSYFAPIVCPRQGPVGSYTLPPGQYDVVVETVSAGDVTPWIGAWGLSGGAEYYNCFYITETSIP